MVRKNIPKYNTEYKNLKSLRAEQALNLNFSSIIIRQNCHAGYGRFKETK